MGYEARDTSRRAQKRRLAERDAQARARKTNGVLLEQTEYPVEREHAGRKTIRRLARLWIKPRP